METRSEHFETGVNETVMAKIKTYMGDNPNVDINKTATAKQRLETKIQKEEDGCWTWTGGIDRGMPTYTYARGKKINIRRYMIESSRQGDLPKSIILSTSCGNSRCVNPDHIGYYNLRDSANINMADKHPFTFKDGKCSRGHDVTLPGAIKIRKGTGQQRCVECTRIHTREYRARKAAAQSSPEETLDNNAGQ